MTAPPTTTTGDAPGLVCSRLLRFPDESSQCPEPAKWHFFWTDDGSNGLACDDHYLEAIEKFSYLAVHPYDLECAPGGIFLILENRCSGAEDA